MREKQVHKPYTTTEVAEILQLYDAGKTPAEIGEKMGRTRSAIYQMIYNMRKGNNPVPTPPHSENAPAPKPTSTMTPREMIKALYDMGYRIENNQLVCYVKQVVKIKDVIQ